MDDSDKEQQEAANTILSLGVTEDAEVARRAAIASRLPCSPDSIHRPDADSVPCRARQKFKGNLDQAVNWIMDGAKEDPAVGAFDNDLPPLIPAGAHNSPVLDEVLPHPSTLGRITDEPPPYSTAAIDFRPPAALTADKEGEPFGVPTIPFRE